MADALAIPGADVPVRRPRCVERGCDVRPQYTDDETGLPVCGPHLRERRRAKAEIVPDGGLRALPFAHVETNSKPPAPGLQPTPKATDGARPVGAAPEPRGSAGEVDPAESVTSRRCAGTPTGAAGRSLAPSTPEATVAGICLSPKCRRTALKRGLCNPCYAKYTKRGTIEDIALPPSGRGPKKRVREVEPPPAVTPEVGGREAVVEPPVPASNRLTIRHYFIDADRGVPDECECGGAREDHVYVPPEVMYDDQATPMVDEIPPAPAEVVHPAPTWLIRAHDIDRDDVRDFAVDRILGADDRDATIATLRDDLLTTREQLADAHAAVARLSDEVIALREHAETAEREGEEQRARLDAVNDVLLALDVDEDDMLDTEADAVRELGRQRDATRAELDRARRVAVEPAEVERGPEAVLFAVIDVLEAEVGRVIGSSLTRTPAMPGLFKALRLAAGAVYL